ncbi:ROK family protein [Listeria valentina]|uniref:ROK family protein n=1 Tax=Listeria valentina TaxID=2705293 RepID=UPI00142F6CD6|nr:ROK family protein [Listeria valentina]
MISSKYTIREQNEAKILNFIIQNKEISRAKLSELSKLNKASVSSITKKLMDIELIFETRIGDSSNVGGRKPIMLSFNKKSSLLLALDIGYNYIEAALAYIDGTIVKSLSQKDKLITSENAISVIEETVRNLTADLPETPHGIVGMTLAIHGQVSNEEIIFTPYYDLDQLDLFTELGARYAFPIYLENEANLSALGEYTFSSEYEKLIAISMHSGIGAGIVESGKLHLGKDGKAGEIGHTIFQPHGKACPCGNNGCLERYGANEVIYDELRELKGLEKVNSNVLVRYYEENDPETFTLLRKYSDILSVGINNIIMMYAPEIVVINSSITRKIPITIDFIKDRVKNRLATDVIIKNTSLGENSTLYGALAFTAQKYLNIERLKLGE